MAFNLLDNNIGNQRRLIISCYYALTTLSTVGYGDYFPISNYERLIAIIIMIMGVAFFSYIMGNFIEIISNYEKKMGEEFISKNSDLYEYILLLTRFNNGQPLPKSLTSAIEQHFSHFWPNDRIAYLNMEDENYLDDLPKKTQNQIMSVYLFSDVFT